MIPFGKYLLLERIAVGGMAEVYLAKSFGIEGFEKLLAIKRILPTMAEDDDFIEMFIDEAKIAGQLNHANVAPIFELGKIGDSHYIAMEYVWGKDLLQIMNRFRKLRKKMAPVMVAWIASKMCEALEYAHTKCDRRGNALNIIHRDVSPQNVLVSYEGEIKLIDFGIAKAASRTTKTQAGVLKGKFGYMSPEQVRGMPVNLRSDLFALGTCMYEMLSAERLFMGESDFSTLEKVRNAAVTPIGQVVNGISSELAQIVMRTLHREPDERFQTAGELQEALQRVLSAERPPFGTAKLAAWLKTAFAAEMAREKLRLDSYAHIGRPSALAGSRRATAAPTSEAAPSAPASAQLPAPPPPSSPAPPPVSVAYPTFESDFDEDEQTVVSASPFEEGGLGPDGELQPELPDAPTQIFFSSESEEVGAPPYVSPGSSIPPMSPAALDPGPDPTIRSTPAAKQASTSRPAPSAQTPTPFPLGPPPQQALPTSEFAMGPDRVTSQPAQGRSLPTIVLAAAVMLGAGSCLGYVLLAPEPVGTLEVETSPMVSAEVIMDGVRMGTVPFRREGIKRGTHDVEIVAEGFEPARRRLVVKGDDTHRIGISLNRVAPPQGTSPAPREDSRAPTGFSQPPPTGTDPVPQAQGHETGQEQPPEEVAVQPPPIERTQPTEREAAAQPSAEQIRRERARREQAEREQARREQARREQAERARREQAERDQPTATPAGSGSEARASTPAYGTLVVNSHPWSRVFVDGRDTGRDTPIRSLRVRAGERSIGLRTADGEMHTFTVEVEAGGSTRLVRSLP